MKKAKICALLVAALMIIGLLTACNGTASSPTPASTTPPAASPTDNTTPGASPSDNSQPVHLTMVAWWGGDPQTQLTAELDAYNAAHPNVTIDLQVWPYDQYADKLATAYAGGSMPDIVATDSSSFLYNLYNTGLIQSLNTLMTNANYDSSTWLPGIKETCSAGGDVITVPLIYDQMVTWYNHDLFQQAGLADLPNNPTWDQIQTDAQAIAALGKDSNGNQIYGLEMANSVVPNYYLAQKGISLAGSDGSFQANTPDVVSAISDLQTMAKTCGGAPAGTDQDPMSTGNVGIYIGWMGVATGSGAAFDSRVVNAPVLDASNGQSILQAVNGLSVSASCQNAAVAFDVISFLTSADQLANMPAFNSNPPFTGAMHDAALQPQTTFPYDAFQIVAPQQNATPILPNTAKWGFAVQSAIQTNWPAVMNQTMTPQDFVNALQTAYDQWDNAQS